MAAVTVGDARFDVELIVFDKDGTLIDFHHMWGRRTETSVSVLLQAVGGDRRLEQALFRGLGYDHERRRTMGSGPLATATLAKIRTVVATVLYQHGLSWEDAEHRAEATFARCFSRLPEAEAIRPRGDVASICRRLLAAGLHLAVATTDDREATKATLRQLAVDELIAHLRCGDDPDGPTKPDPDVLHQLARDTNVRPQHVMMVGDTPSDLTMARRAGAVAVGVTGGAGRPSDLAPHADALVESIAAIEV